MGPDGRGGVALLKMIVAVTARPMSWRRITLITVLEVREEEPALGWSVPGASAEDVRMRRGYALR